MVIGWLNLDLKLGLLHLNLPKKVRIVKAMVFPVVMYGCESWTIKKADWAPRNWCFWTVVLEKTLESPLDCKEIKPAARLPCPALTPGICSNSCPLSQWCHPTILSCVTHFSFCPQPFPPSGSFPVSQSFISGGQSIKASTSAFPMNI